MEEVFVSTLELSDITGVAISTLRPWLGNYRFSKFITKVKLNGRYKLAVKLNKQCAYRLCEMFMKYQREDAIRNLEKYFEDRENGNK